MTPSLLLALHAGGFALVTGILALLRRSAWVLTLGLLPTLPLLLAVWLVW